MRMVVIVLELSKLNPPLSQSSFIHAFSDRIPNDPSLRSKWETALETQQCGSSDSVCIQHFVSDDYYTTSKGKIVLKSGAVPSVFATYMVEVIEIDNQPNSIFNLDSQANECSSITCKETFLELQQLKLKNEKLLKEIDQIKWNHKTVRDVLIKHLKEINSKQSKEISLLKKEMAHCKTETEKLQASLTKIYGILNEPEVNISTNE